MSDRRPSRWARVNQVLDEVLDLKPEEHKAFLDEHCTDPSIRADVRSLLHEIEAAEKEGFLDGPIDLEAAAFHDALEGLDVENGDDQTGDDVALLEMIGETIGAYRIERVLGRGGMGAVFLAERDDGEYQQQVALKVMRRDLFEREDLMARLRRERQIMASLDHEHVARLLDGGVDGKGRPYIVMEYIEGETIDAYCDGQGLNIDDRLRLFQQVGKAVAAAHRRAVIHRDLKPSNVLIHEHEVGGDGLAQTEPRAKLLDFGIAKLVEPDADPAGEDCLGRDSSRTALTRTGMAVMTPEYAAPEQIQDEGVTTATDVYQLGVVLYELLTGQRPFRDETSGKRGRAHLRALEEAILTTEPERPSTAATRLGDEAARKTRGSDAMQLSQRLRGDLDAICLKALRKEPEFRYASVDAMLEDIARYLDGRPVSARRRTTWYRTRKFVGRNWKGVVTGLALATIFAVSGFLYATQVAAERDRAELEAQKAEEVTEFLISLFNASNPYAAAQAPEEMRVADVLDRAEERLKTYESNNPELQATLIHAVGRVYNRIAEYDKAGRLLRQAQSMRQSALESNPEWMYETYDELATHYVNLGEYKKALAASDTALTASIRAYGRESEEHASVLALIGSIYNEGRTEPQSLEKAETAMREAIEIRRSLPSDQDYNISTLLDGLGTNLIYQNRYSEADSVLQSSLALKRQTVDSTHWGISTTLNNIAGVHLERGRHGDAIPLLRESVRIRKSIISDHPDIGTAMSNLGRSLLETDSLAEAEAVLREGLGIYRRTLGPDHNWNAYILRSLSSLYRRKGEVVEAESLAREAMRIDRNAGFNDTNWRIIYNRNLLAAALIDQNRFADAEKVLMPMAEILRSVSSKDPPGDLGRRSSSVYRRIVDLYGQWGKSDLAHEWEMRWKAATADTPSS